MNTSFLLRGLVAAASLLCASAFAQGKGADDMEAQLEKVRKIVLTQGKVCTDPDKPCPDFEANELSFKIGKKFDFDRGQDQSQPFYAVLLKSGELCKIPEQERVATQALFPRRKVFLHRYFCNDFGDNVTYTSVNRKVGFIAVYAGETETEAKQFLAEVKATGKFPDANIRKMQAVVVYQLE